MTRTYRGADAALVAANLSALAYGPGRGPLGIGLTSGTTGFWEISGDTSRERWGQYQGGPMEGQASWTKVIAPTAQRQPPRQRGGGMVVLAAQPKAKRPKRSPKATGSSGSPTPGGTAPGVQPPGEPTPIGTPGGPVLDSGAASSVLGSGDASSRVWDDFGHTVPTLGVRRRGDIRRL